MRAGSPLFPGFLQINQREQETRIARVEVERQAALNDLLQEKTKVLEEHSGALLKASEVWEGAVPRCSSWSAYGRLPRRERGKGGDQGRSA